jgi:outer membrane protein OmpA-like peptidoglycan-associated protein
MGRRVTGRAMRRSILGSATVCASALAIWMTITGRDSSIPFVSLMYDGVTAIDRQVDGKWQQRELAFLKSIHDRIQIELQNQSQGSASLQRENRLILDAMADVAKTMSSNNIPADVKVLLAGSRLTSDDAIGSLIEAIVPKTPLELSAEGAEGLGANYSTDPAPLAAAMAVIEQASAEPVELAVTPTSQLPHAEPHLSPSQTQREVTILHAEKTDRGYRIRVPADALFGTEDTTLDAADPNLSQVLELIREMQPREIVVLGHTDASKTRDADLTLSKERARAVFNWLKAHGVDNERHLVARGYGGSRPVATNENADGSDNPTGRAQNRRIEILLRRQ